MEGTGLTSIISSVTEIFTAAVGWVGDVATTITGTPILLVFCILPLIGVGIGLFKRLLG